MTSGSYDFADYQVLVVGGTRGEGHTIATACRDELVRRGDPRNMANV